MSSEFERDGANVAASEAAVDGASALDAIAQETQRLAPLIAPGVDKEAENAVRSAVQQLIITIARSNRKADEKIDRVLIDRLIAEIDVRMSKQVDEILHHPDFQKLEAAWTSLKYVVDRTDFDKNIQIKVLNVSKDALLEDFQDNPEDRTRSGLYHVMHRSAYGVFGGQPYGAAICNYEFGPGSRDVSLLAHLGAVGQMTHAPFVAAAAPSFFGIEDYQSLQSTIELKEHFAQTQFTKWNEFRRTEDARYVALTMPRFLLRLPYDPSENPTKSFAYREDVHEERADPADPRGERMLSRHQRYLWGNAAFAFASRMTESFANYGWCNQIIGPQAGGAVEDLPLHVFESYGALKAKIPTETLIDERRDFTLSEQGFVPLVSRKDSSEAVFFSANSCQAAKTFQDNEEGKRAEASYRLSMQLPYMNMMNRLAHYLKVQQREYLGSWASADDLQQILDKWIKQYVSDQKGLPQELRSRRPLRKGQVVVTDVAGRPGWYTIDLQAIPHFKLENMDITLSLVAEFERMDGKK